MDSFGQSASGNHAGTCVALPGGCTPVQPALLADQALVLWKPDTLACIIVVRQLDAHQQGQQGNAVQPVALTTRQLAVRMQARRLVTGSDQASAA